MRTLIVRAVGVLAVAFIAIQLVPYGWAHPNPPETLEAPWPDRDVRQVAVDACYDCHSNVTDWPIYSYVAPMSWLVRRDVEEGRDKLNFSTWNLDDHETEDAIETILDGSMPPLRYVLLHPDARLTAAEQQRLITTLQTFAAAGDD